MIDEVLDMGRTFINIDEELIKEMDKAGIKNGKIMMLYGKILSLSQNDQNACMASNKYFANVLCTEPRNIQRYIKELKDLGFIKTYEENDSSQYAFTVARFIYPQWKVVNGKLCHDGTTDMSQGNENMDTTPRQMMSNPMTDNVERHDNLCREVRQDRHPNNRENREKRIDKNDVPLRCTDSRFAPGVANAPGSADATQSNMRKRFNYFKSLDYDAVIPSEELPRIVAISYAELDPDIYDSIDSRREKLIKDFTSGYYKAKNKDNITKLIDAVIAGEIQEGK